MRGSLEVEAQPSITRCGLGIHAISSRISEATSNSEKDIVQFFALNYFDFEGIAKHAFEIKLINTSSRRMELSTF